MKLYDSFPNDIKIFKSQDWTRILNINHDLDSLIGSDIKEKFQSH